MLLDEDIEGTISIEEYTNALEAYGLSGEKHKPLDGTVLHHTFQQKCMFKMILALQKKNITYSEVYNACDINDDQKVSIAELRNFIEGLSSDFKVKEIHALIGYLDLQNNGILTKEGFLKQLTKGEQMMNQSLTLNKKIAEKRVYQRAQQNNFMYSPKSQNNKSIQLLSPQKEDQDDSFARFVIEDAGEGDQGVQQPLPQKNPINKSPAKPTTSVTLTKQAIPPNLTPEEVKLQQIVQKMEKEGINLQTFVDTIKGQVVNGCVSLGSMLKLFQTSYPSINTSERTLLINNCLKEKSKVDFVQFEDLLSKYSKNLMPSVTQFFQTIAQNIVKQMGSSPQDSIKMFFKAQNLNEFNNIPELEFYQIFQRVAPNGLPQVVFNKAFQSLDVDSDGFAIVQDIISVLVSYVSFAGTKLMTSLASNDLKKIVPDIDLMSPRTRCEKLVIYFAKELAAKNIKPISLFKMADTSNSGTVNVSALEAAFKKIFQALKLEIIQELMQAFTNNLNSDQIKREDFEAVFQDELVVGKNNVLAQTTKEEKKADAQVEEEMAVWIKKLDNALQMEGVSPAVAFKSADSNRDGSISLEELKETIKRLIPHEILPYLDVLKIVKAFDNKNKVIREQEFVNKLQKARNTASIIVDSSQNNQSLRDNRGLPVKDSDLQQKKSEPQTNATKVTLLLNQLDEKINLKKVFSELTIGEDGRIVITNITSRLKREVASDGSTLKPSDYMPVIKELDNKNEGSVNALDAIKFLEIHLRTYSHDCTFELKYIANFIEFKMKNRNTKTFFENNSKLRSNTRIMEIEIMTELNNCFGVPTSIGTKIFKKLAEINKSNFTLDDLCALIDQHRLVKIQPAKPQTESEKLAGEKIVVNVKEKIKAMNKRLFAEMVAKFQEIDNKEKQIPFQDFQDEFVTMNLLVTDIECRTLYIHIKNSSQGIFNYESLVNFQIFPKREVGPKITQTESEKQNKAVENKKDAPIQTQIKSEPQTVPSQSNGPIDPVVLVKAIESQLGQSIEEALDEKFLNNDIMVLHFIRQLSPATRNVDKNYLTSLGKIISPENKGKLTMKEIIGFLKTIPGKYRKLEVIQSIADQIADPIADSLKENNWEPLELYSKHDFLNTVQDISKVSNFKGLGLFYDLTLGADEIQGKILIQALQATRSTSSQSKQQNKNEATIIIPLKIQEQIEKLNKEFIASYKNIQNQAKGAISKFSSIIAKKSAEDIIQAFDSSGKGIISIDWFHAHLDKLCLPSTLTSDEKLLVSYTAIDSHLLTDQISLPTFISSIKIISQHPTLLETLQNIYMKLSTPTKGQKVEETSNNLLAVSMKPRGVDTFLARQEEQLKNVVEAFRANMLDNNTRQAFIKMFESKPNQEVQTDELFDHVTQHWRNANIQDQEIIVFEKDVDETQTGRIRLCDIVKFCTDHKIDLQYKGTIKKADNIDNRRETLPGETLTCGKLTYKVVPELDYYKGIPTILTSEEAALVVCNKMFNALGNSEQFFDQDFGPKNQNDKEGSAKAMYFSGEGPAGCPDPEFVEWLRPEEYCNESPEFINEGASANDVRQGAIGNCWFISALSVLATRDELVRGGIGSMEIDENFEVNQEIAMNFSNGVYPSIFHVYRFKGMFVFRFYKNFQWLYVVVDDRIPTEGRKPVFGHCKDDHELWVPLIEKAYAKLHGCYESLISGYIDDGLTDLTGFVAEKIQLHQQNQFPAKPLGTIDDFWNFLLKRRAEKCLMGCSRAAKGEQRIQLDEDEEVTGVPDGQDCGIIAGHAYGLMDVFEIPDQAMQNPRKTHRILRVRNPWGNGEWTGKWSSESEELRTYSEQIDKYIESMQDQDEKFDPFEEDGTFLINYRNWRTIYNNMFVCIDFPESWSCVRYYSRWDAESAGGTPLQYNTDNRKMWAKNPQYCLENKHPGEMEIFISLAQQDQRGCYKNGEPIKYPFNDSIHSMTFSVIHVPFTNPKAAPKLLTIYDHTVTKGAVVKQTKEISMRVKMPQGYIYIVPSTAVAGLEGDFILSIYFSKPKTRIHFHRLDRPSENNYQTIKEESNNANAVPEWKVVECEKRLRAKTMIFEEDNAQQVKVQLKNAPKQMLLQSKKKNNLKNSTNPILGKPKSAKAPPIKK